MDLLDKTYGSTRTKAQLDRNKTAFDRLHGEELAEGELYALVHGEPAPLAPDKAINPVTVTGRRTACITCRQPLEWAGQPLQSQPRRCLICGRLRRKAHNTEQARRRINESATPESGERAEALLSDLAS